MSVELRATSHESRATSSGFSLMEVLLAVGTLAVGMLFIAGVFPVGIHFTTVSTERTMAAIVADEAFAKIKLLGLLPATDVNWSAGQAPFEFVATTQPATDYFAYPSTHTNFMQKKYFWSAVCRRVGSTDVQVTVFVSRKTGVSTRYHMRNPLPLYTLTTTAMPVPVYVSVTHNLADRPDELQINDLVAPPGDEATFINDGSTIVDNVSGQIYRVLERLTPPRANIIRLDKNWQWPAGVGAVWVVPPPKDGGRNPCIAVYQKVMRF